MLRSVLRLIGDLIEGAEDEAVSFPAILGGGPSRPYATALYIAFWPRYLQCDAGSAASGTDPRVGTQALHAMWTLANRTADRHAWIDDRETGELHFPTGAK